MDFDMADRCRASTVLLLLMCHVYRTGGYYCKWNEEELCLFADYIPEDTSFINLVIKRAIGRELIDKGRYEQGYITSQAMLERFVTAKDIKWLGKIDTSIAVLPEEYQDIVQGKPFLTILDFGKGAKRYTVQPPPEENGSIGEEAAPIKVQIKKKKTEDKLCIEGHTYTGDYCPVCAASDKWKAPHVDLK